MQLVSKISNLCDPDPPTSQTDGQSDRQTDGRHAISIPRYALVHRAVKSAAVAKKANRTAHDVRYNGTAENAASQIAMVT